MNLSCIIIDDETRRYRPGGTADKAKHDLEP